MATRLKTVEYFFPTLSWAENNVVTNFKQIIIYLPESSKVFKSVAMEVYSDDVITATGSNFNKRNMNLQLGSAAYSANNNTQTLTGSGENQTIFITGDYTSYFSANWSGSSMTCDASIEFNESAGTTLGMRDTTAKLMITYEYDDTSETQIKTVWMPLNAPSTYLDAAKPTIPNDVIPVLDTWLPETGKDIKQITIIVQGNDSIIAAAANVTMSMTLGTYGTMSTGARVSDLASCRWFRYFWTIDVDNPSVMIDTSVSHNFYIWCDVASRHGHLQVWMAITYQYNDPLSNFILNSLLLPMEMDSPFGGPSIGLSQQASRLLWIEEPEPIELKSSALLVFYEGAATITGLAIRAGKGPWVALTDGTAALAGGMGGMIRCEQWISLERGKNILKTDAYRTGTTNGGFNVSFLWMLNYTSSKSSNGAGAHNHTVRKNMVATGTGAAAMYQDISSMSFSVPETSVFFNSLGFHYTYFTNNGLFPSGLTIQALRLVAEGGPKWEPIYTDLGYGDGENGIRQSLSTARNFFKRFTGDVNEGTRIDVATSRNYQVFFANSCTVWGNLDYLITYHSITSTISGTITNYTGDGSGITVDIFRVEDNEYILSTTTSAGGTYSVTWFDNTAPLFAIARQDGVYVGRSDNSYAVLT